ncbi:MAG: arginine--tRNA ligase [Bacteroidales bacterium]|jgi:arginyl-tRNA synthetase
MMIEKLLQEKTSEAISKLYDQLVAPESIAVEKTKKEISGDYTVVVFSLSRISRKSPEITAQEIGNFLVANIELVREFTVIKGFLNLTLKDNWWIAFMDQNLNDPAFGMKVVEDGHPVLLEYSSPNTNKPLHLGHIRNNLLGFSLARILEANGHKVVKLNLVNDRGIHICKSMLAYMKWGNNETPASSGLKSDHLIGKYYVLFDRKYKEEVRSLVEEGMNEDDAMRQAPLITEAQELLQKWEAKDHEVHELWTRMNDWALAGFNETYNNLGVSFDLIQHESETYLSGKDIVMVGVKEGGFIRKEDGSIWVDLTKEGLDEKLLLRGDGTSVYMTQDLGTAQLRYNEFNPSKMIYVVGNEQNYHFDVLKRTLKKLGREWADMIFHLSYGMVELPEGKMKSREGTVVDADDLIQEMVSTAEETTRALGKVDTFPEEEAKDLFRIIGLGALKYFILKVDPKKNMLFDPKESIDFNGNTGPFIQYTYARIRSLLKKSEKIIGDQNLLIKYKSADDPIVLPLLPVEKEILKLLYQFPALVQQSGDSYSPAAIANYVYDLSKEYNQFYQEIPVLKEENQSIRIMRLKLSLFTGEIIKKAAWLLGIEVPERM